MGMTGPTPATTAHHHRAKERDRGVALARQLTVAAGAALVALASLGTPADASPYGHPSPPPPSHPPSPPPQPPVMPPQPPVRPPAVQDRIIQQQMREGAAQAQSRMKAAASLPPVTARTAQKIDDWSDFGNLTEDELTALFRENGWFPAGAGTLSGSELKAMMLGAASGPQRQQLMAMPDSQFARLAGALNNAVMMAGAGGDPNRGIARLFKREYAKTCMCGPQAFADALGRAETQFAANVQSALIKAMAGQNIQGGGMVPAAPVVVYSVNDPEISIAQAMINAGQQVAANNPPPPPPGGGGGGGNAAPPAPPGGGGGGNPAPPAPPGGGGGGGNPAPPVPPGGGGGGSGNPAPPAPPGGGGAVPPGGGGGAVPPGGGGGGPVPPGGGAAPPAPPGNSSLPPGGGGGKPPVDISGLINTPPPSIEPLADPFEDPPGPDMTPAEKSEPGEKMPDVPYVPPVVEPEKQCATVECYQAELDRLARERKKLDIDVRNEPFIATLDTVGNITSGVGGIGCATANPACALLPIGVAVKGLKALITAGKESQKAGVDGASQGERAGVFFGTAGMEIGTEAGKELVGGAIGKLVPSGLVGDFGEAVIDVGIGTGVDNAGAIGNAAMNVVEGNPGQVAKDTKAFAGDVGRVMTGGGF